MWKGSCVSCQVHFIFWFFFIASTKNLDDFLETCHEHELYLVWMESAAKQIWLNMKWILKCSFNFLKLREKKWIIYIHSKIVNNLDYFFILQFYTFIFCCHVFKQKNCFNLYKWWWKKIKINKPISIFHLLLACHTKT